ncbi:MAG TPA: phytanoyl-CoA dioxygenase family protein [Verrucomicrobiales bacterium]|nr:phytanoyl-CoA dioxygenase family protein [Verrucomicrobiales bacterium]
MTPQVEPDGFAMVEDVLSAQETRQLLDELGDSGGAGRRGLLALPAVATLAKSEKLLALTVPWLPGPARPVRALYFDKTAETNWVVPWHQDLTLALAGKAEVTGFGPWSEKDGIPHVQPPARLLEQMLTIRIHLDDTHRVNGALRVLPGSHRHGRLSAAGITEWRAQTKEFLCEAKAGDALLMRPLILHASGRSTGGGHRRVLHLEYAGFALPGGLQWHEAA